MPALRPALAVAVLAAAVYWGTFLGRLRSIDEHAIFTVADSLVKHGSLNANALAANYFASGDSLVVPGPSGDFYSHKGVLPSVLAAPLLWLALRLPNIGLVHAALLENIGFTAGAAGLLYWTAARLGFSSRASLATALSFSIGTLAWPYAQTLLSEPNAAFVWLLALAVLLAREGLTPRRAAGLTVTAGALAGLAVGASYVYVIAVPVLAAYAVLSQRAHGRRAALTALAWFSLGALIGLGLILWLNQVRFGHWLDTGYTLQGEGLRLPGFHVRLFGLLLSPYRGLLWYVPLTVLAPLGLAWLWGRRPAEALLCAGLSLAVIAAYSLWTIWWGGVNWGPRYLVPLMPFVCLALAPVWERGLRARWPLRMGLLALALVSVLVQVVGVTTDFAAYDFAYWLDYGPALSAAAPIAAVPLLYAWRLSPLLLQTRDLLAGRLDLAWISTTGFDALGLGLGLLALAVAAWAVARPHARLALPLASLVFAGVITMTLPRVPASPTSAGVDTLVAHLRASAAPGDLVVQMLPFRYGEFANANTLPLPVYGLPWKEAPLRPEMAALLADLAAEPRALWVLADDSPTADPQNGVEAWLVEHAFKFDHAYAGPVRLSGFLTAPALTAPQPRAERFGDHLRLASIQVSPDGLGPGQILALAVTWEALAPITEPPTVFLHLEDITGQLVAQRDAAPFDGYLPVTAWLPGQPVTDRLGLQLPAHLPPGDYQLYLGLYHPATGQRLALHPPQPSDRLLLTTLHLTP